MRLAFTGLPSPSVLATSAEPPVPSMNPTAPSTISRGIIRLMAANGVLPTKLDTKMPSTTLYIDVKIIITTLGHVNRTSLR